MKQNKAQIGGVGKVGCVGVCVCNYVLCMCVYDSTAFGFVFYLFLTLVCFSTHLVYRADFALPFYVS